MREASFVLDDGLVCFNNFYYCRSANDTAKNCVRLVCFNNFYYCRLKEYLVLLLLASMLQ